MTRCPTADACCGRNARRSACFWQACRQKRISISRSCVPQQRRWFRYDNGSSFLSSCQPGSTSCSSTVVTSSSRPKHLSVDQKEIVATVCYAAAQCQVGFRQAVDPAGPYIAGLTASPALLQGIGSLQTLVGDLQQRLNEQQISSIASCNPDNPDTKLRISDNTLRWGDMYSQGRKFLVHNTEQQNLSNLPSSDALVLPGCLPRSTGRGFMPMPLRKQSMNGKSRGMSHLRWRQHERNWTRIEHQPGRLGPEDGHPGDSQAEKSPVVKFAHPTHMPVEGDCLPISPSDDLR